MIRRYRWKQGLTGQRPDGVELGRCYVVRNHSDESGTKANEYDLLDDDGKPIARKVPRLCLEECRETDDCQRGSKR